MELSEGMTATLHWGETETRKWNMRKAAGYEWPKWLDLVEEAPHGEGMSATLHWGNDAVQIVLPRERPLDLRSYSKMAALCAMSFRRAALRRVLQRWCEVAQRRWSAEQLSSIEAAVNSTVKFRCTRDLFDWKITAANETYGLGLSESEIQALWDATGDYERQVAALPEWDASEAA